MTRRTLSGTTPRDDDQSTGHPLAEFVRIRSMQLSLWWICLRADSQKVHDCSFQPDPWTLVGPMPQFESATSINVQQVHALDVEVDALVSLATEESIEDGMESNTETCLNHFVAMHSIGGIQRLSARLASGCINAGTAADIVRVLGRIRHEESHDQRLWVATRLLRSDAPLTRDASAVALEDLADQRAIRALQTAAGVERIPQLKADIEMALHELKKSIDGVHTSEA